MINSKFPKNKIGSALFHEHNDDRIHIEGSVKLLKDFDLSSYFEVVGGKLENGHLVYPSVNGEIEKRNGDLCIGESRLKVYVNGKKIENYVFEPHISLIYKKMSNDDKNEISKTLGIKKQFKIDSISILHHSENIKNWKIVKRFYFKKLQK